MADNTLVLCGGTGAHVALAFLRLHFLGASLGYFRRGDGNLAVFPELFLVDQDAGDGADAGSTAWQTVRFLVEHHPGRLERASRMGRNEAPAIRDVRPLPVGPRNDWYRPPHDSLQGRFASSPLLPLLFAEKQRRIQYSQGMMGSPALGSMLFKLKEYDERETGVNNDEVFGELLRKEGRIVVAGSGVGGTGASVTPTLARRLADRRGNSVMAAILLSWFKFDEQVADPELRERAAIKNRVLQQNAHSALEFCGQSLARHVATVPVGMPEGALVLREFTGDFAQPVCESFAHYVAALAAFRHFTSDNPYGQGLFAMGALGRGRLDGPTAIPGGTLQDLVNRAATLVDLLDVWGRMLSTPQTDRIVPSLYAEVVRLKGDPLAVANALGEEAGRYREQLDEVAAVLNLKPEVQAGMTLEQRCRSFLAKGGLATGSDSNPLRMALAIFHRAADEVRGAASEQNLLTVRSGHPESSHWPDLHRPGITIPVRQNGDLNAVPEGNIPVVIQAIVNREVLSANGWPHPLAAADFFKDAIRQRDATAWRQLEILLVGVASGLLEVREVELPAVEEAVSLEAVVREYERREGFEGVGRLGVYLRSERGEERLIAFSSPYSVLAPVPFLDDAADNAMWQGLWEKLSGAADGESWRTARAPLRWREERAVWLVRSWLARERSVRGEDGPAWSKLFEGLPSHNPVSVGIGKGLRVFWRGSQLVDLNLPDKEHPNWNPDASVPERAVDDLRRQLPELAAVEGYSEVEFEMPGVAGTVRGWWREHLDELRQAGRIFAFGQLPNRQVAIGTLVGGSVHKTIFSGALILGRVEVAIQKVTPLVQKPIFGNAGSAGSLRFPDIPLKAEYFGLATSADRPLLAVARSAERFPDRIRPVESNDSSGRPQVTWRVPVLGRRDPLVVTISLAEEPESAAHWMVWPRFRSADPSRWRSYYLYDHCRNPNLACDVLWLEGTEPGVSRLQLKERQQPAPRMEPLRYDTQPDSRAHTGGPPLALCLRNQRSGEQRGLYLVGLEILQSADVRLNLSIDFGTSHSVVAIEQGAERAKKVVALAAELDPASRSRALSLHLSEDRDHISEEGGLGENGNWMPNYRPSAGDMVPSELILYRALDQATGDDLSAWLPLQHYTIPPLDLSRSDLGELIVSGFKWDASSKYFQGREPQLREHFQSLLLELALADVVFNELRNIPSGIVGVTFCYPLRSQRDQIQAMRSTIDKVLRRTQRSTGIQTVAYNEIGVLDESRAAAVRREQAGEVCMVADLGGGTLDVLISGYDAQRRQLDEVADSVRLGGNLLLREIIQASASYMPKNGGWDKHPESKLNAWIRGKGAASLWGPDAGSRPKFPELEVLGFERPAEANLARQLINRYFSLIVDFLARNLAAYLTGVWYPAVKPADHSQLSVAVQLRGNGWKLRYQSETENERNQAIQEMVRRRLESLWQELPAEAREYPMPASWLGSSGFSSVGAKTAPALGAVGVAMSHDEVRSSWHTCTLVEVEVLRDSGAQPVPWISRVPFDTGGLTGVQLTKVSPAVPIDPAGVEKPVVLRGLDPELQGQVNRALQNDGRLDGSRFAAPISAEVWETLFRVPEFWPHKGAR